MFIEGHHHLHLPILSIARKENIPMSHTSYSLKEGGRGKGGFPFSTNKSMT
jgi:hypothetical protein